MCFADGNCNNLFETSAPVRSLIELSCDDPPVSHDPKRRAVSNVRTVVFQASEEIKWKVYCENYSLWAQ